MINLFQFPRSKSIPSDSPFCMKTESYFRAVKLPYENIFMMDPRKSPTGKIPYISDGTKIISDSGIIIEHYDSTLESPMQNDLTKQEKATSLAYIRMLEEHLYWAVVYSRWVDPEGIKLWQKKLQDGLNIPKIAFKLMFPTVKKKIFKQLDGQGLGRHSLDQIYKFAQQDIKAISAYLDDKTYFYNDHPTLLDHCAYSYTASLLSIEHPCLLKDIILEAENLVKHYKLMMNQFFPEFKSLEINS